MPIKTNFQPKFGLGASGSAPPLGNHYRELWQYYGISGQESRKIGFAESRNRQYSTTFRQNSAAFTPLLNFRNVELNKDYDVKI